MSEKIQANRIDLSKLIQDGLSDLKIEGGEIMGIGPASYRIADKIMKRYFFEIPAVGS